MKKSLLFLLLAFLLPGLASAANMAIQKTHGDYSTYYNGRENRLAIPCEGAGFSSPMDGSESYTIAAWLKPSNLVDGAVVLALSPQVHMNNNGNWVLKSDTNGKLSFGGHGGSDTHGILASTGIAESTELNSNINIDQWNYVAVALDNSAMKISVFVNGTLTFESSLWQKVYFPENLQNGGDGPAYFNVGAYGMDALIDEVHVFNKALTADELAQAYTSPVGMESLTGYYTFDELGEEEGYFNNESPNAPANSRAVLYEWYAYNLWQGWINGTNTPTAATLVEGRGTTDPDPAPTGLTYRRKYTDSSKRYLSEIAYNVFGNTTAVYQTADPTSEPYFVAPTGDKKWYEEGAYIDFKDKVIEIPADATNFTMTLKGISGSKWSQTCVYVDWNNNGSFIDAGETNGVIDRDLKPNAAIEGAGNQDVITLPAGLNEGDTFSMLICLNEPKGVDGEGDMWEKQWEWSTEIFNNNVCSVVNGQAYELTVKITAPTPQTYSFQVPSADQFADVNVTSVTFLDGSSPLTPGSTITGIVAGTAFQCAVTTAAGYTLTGFKVGDVDASIQPLTANQSLVGFLINSDVTADMITMTTEKTKYAVTVTQPENATITVMNGETEVHSGDKVEGGTVLTLSCTPAEGFALVNYTLDGQPVEGNTVTMPEAECTISATIQQEVSLVSTKDYVGTLKFTLFDETSTIENATVYFDTMSDGTYTLRLENFGADDQNPAGMGNITVSGITREGDNLTGHADEIILMDGFIKASADLTGVIEGTEDITINLAVVWHGDNGDVDIPVVFTTKKEKPAMTYRRKYTDGSKRYFSEIAYNVFNTGKTVYQTADPTSEPYFVAPTGDKKWYEEGAYIDFKDKVIEIPANAENFTITLKGITGTAVNWSQTCVYVDWNDNGSFIDAGETNGVIDRDLKPNAAIVGEGNKDVITLPAGLSEGDTFSMLICLNEPKGVDGEGDMWEKQWEWSTEIFNNNVCSVVNGQAYELTVKITAADTSAISGIGVDGNDADVEYYNLQGIRVDADQLVPGIYILRQGNKTSKVLVK